MNKILKIIQEKISERVESLTFLSEGASAKVYKAETENKVYAIKEYKKSGICEKEVRQLEYIKNCSQLPVPKVLFKCCLDDNAELYCMEYFEGVSAIKTNPYKYTKKQIASFANTIVDNLIYMHQFTSDNMAILTIRNLTTGKNITIILQ